MIINTAQHKMIGRVLDALNDIPGELFDESELYIKVELEHRKGYFKINFEDEFADWTYTWEEGPNG